MTSIALPVAVLAGITLHAAVFHLLLYARSDRLQAHLYFGITALAISLFDLCCVGLYSSTDLAHGAFWQRAQLAVVMPASVSLLNFFSAYAEVPRRRWTTLIAWLFPLVGAVTMFERSGLMVTETPAIKHFSLPLFGDITYFETELGPLYYVTIFEMLYVTGYAWWAARQLYLAGEPRRAMVVATAIALFAVGGLSDALVALRAMDFIYLTEYTWTSIIALAGYALSSELLQAAEARRLLAESKVRLAHAERLESVGKLAGGVAHDLNNMLTPVLGYAQLLQDLAAPDSREREYLEDLTGAATRAAALTQRLLAFARKQVLEVKPLNLLDSLVQLEPLLRRLLPENMSLRFEADHDVPAVDADRAQLEQVWMNLASNARDAMPQGGTLSFTLTHAQPSGDRRSGVLVRVRDTGEGMSPSVLERAFDPFFSTKGRGQGTGLGLSIVFGIVEQHGGAVMATSVVGKGTEIQLYFPASERSASSPPPEPQRRRIGPRARMDQRVLVLDDETAVLRLVVEVLEHYGFDVLAASSQRELERLLASELPHIDLLLTDVMLPDTDGVQICRSVLQRFPGVACVFMTGHADDVLAPRGVLREHVELLHKPFTAAELIDKVTSVLLARAEDRRAAHQSA